jgi:hypothetical protein
MGVIVNRAARRPASIVRAELSGRDTSVACGMTVRAPRLASPCRSPRPGNPCPVAPLR